MLTKIHKWLDCPGSSEGTRDGVEATLSFSVFSENMQRKASQTTRVEPVFPKLPFSKMATPTVHSKEHMAESIGCGER